MANDPTIEVGTKVIGKESFRGLKGKVIDTKESGFGMKWALVEPKSSSDPYWDKTTSHWARTIYLSPRD